MMRLRAPFRTARYEGHLIHPDCVSRAVPISELYNPRLQSYLRCTVSHHIRDCYKTCPCTLPAELPSFSRVKGRHFDSVFRRSFFRAAPSSSRDHRRTSSMSASHSGSWVAYVPMLPTPVLPRASSVTHSILDGEDTPTSVLTSCTLSHSHHKSQKQSPLRQGAQSKANPLESFGESGLKVPSALYCCMQLEVDASDSFCTHPSGVAHY